MNKDKLEQLLMEISRKLSILIRLSLKDEELTIKEGVKLLSQFDLSNKEISQILGISEKHVAKEKSLIKKRVVIKNG